MPTYDYIHLEQIAAELLEAAGTPPDTAGGVARSLVLSNRVGHDSHGIILVWHYLPMLRDGRIAPSASGRIVQETPSMALIDGQWGFGQVVAAEAIKCAMEKARGCAIAAVGVYRISHVGRLGEYTEMAAAEGLAAFAFVNTPGKRPVVAPFGGAKAVWGTNPVAVALPTGEPVFSIDFATSKIAFARATLARNEGTGLPDGCAINSEGRPTQDPWDLVHGGALLPFGEHKGYALAFLVELLSGALIGSVNPEPAGDRKAAGLFFVVFDPERFCPRDSFDASVRGLFQTVKACPPAEGFEEVMIPGEPEHRQRLISDTAGVFVADSVCEKLNEVARELGVVLAWREK